MLPVFLDAAILSHPQPYPQGPSLDGIMEKFIFPIDQGMHLIFPTLNTIFFYLAIAEFAFFGLYMALGKNQSFPAIVEKLLEFGFLYYVFENFPKLAGQFLNGLLYLTHGMMGSTSESAALVVQSPDQLILDGYKNVLAPMNQYFANQPELSLMNIGSFLPGLAAMLAFGVAWLAAGACFIVMAIQLAIAQIEFKIILAFAWMIMPFSVFKPLEFIARPSITAIVAQCFKVVLIALTTSLIAAAYVTVINQNYIDSTVAQIKYNEGTSGASGGTSQTVFDVMYAVMAISAFSIFLSLQVPAMVAPLVGGLPHLTASGMFQNVVAAARAIGAVGRGANGTVGKAADGVAASINKSSSGGATATTGGSPNAPGPKDESQRIRQASQAAPDQKAANAQAFNALFQQDSPAPRNPAGKAIHGSNLHTDGNQDVANMAANMKPAPDKKEQRITSELRGMK